MPIPRVRAIDIAPAATTTAAPAAAVPPTTATAVDPSALTPFTLSSQFVANPSLIEELKKHSLLDAFECERQALARTLAHLIQQVITCTQQLTINSSSSSNSGNSNNDVNMQNSLPLPSLPNVADMVAAATATAPIAAAPATVTADASALSSATAAATAAAPASAATSAITAPMSLSAASTAAEVSYVISRFELCVWPEFVRKWGQKCLQRERRQILPVVSVKQRAGKKKEKAAAAAALQTAAQATEFAAPTTRRIAAPTAAADAATSPSSASSSSASHSLSQSQWDPHTKGTVTSAATTLLQQWFLRRILDPYPSDTVKAQLARRCRLSVSQVSAWFINARMRKWEGWIEKLKTGELVLMTEEQIEEEMRRSRWDEPQPAVKTERSIKRETKRTVKRELQSATATADGASEQEEQEADDADMHVVERKEEKRDSKKQVKRSDGGRKADGSRTHSGKKKKQHTAAAIESSAPDRSGGTAQPSFHIRHPSETVHRAQHASIDSLHARRVYATAALAQQTHAHGMHLQPQKAAQKGQTMHDETETDNDEQEEGESEDEEDMFADDGAAEVDKTDGDDRADSYILAPTAAGMTHQRFFYPSTTGSPAAAAGYPLSDPYMHLQPLSGFTHSLPAAALGNSTHMRDSIGNSFAAPIAPSLTGSIDRQLSMTGSPPMAQATYTADRMSDSIHGGAAGTIAMTNSSGSSGSKFILNQSPQPIASTSSAADDRMRMSNSNDNAMVAAAVGDAASHSAAVAGGQRDLSHVFLQHLFQQQQQYAEHQSLLHSQSHSHIQPQMMQSSYLPYDAYAHSPSLLLSVPLDTAAAAASAGIQLHLPTGAAVTYAASPTSVVGNANAALPYTSMHSAAHSYSSPLYSGRVSPMFAAYTSSPTAGASPTRRSGGIDVRGGADMTAAAAASATSPRVTQRTLLIHPPDAAQPPPTMPSALSVARMSALQHSSSAFGQTGAAAATPTLLPAGRTPSPQISNFAAFAKPTADGTVDAPARDQ